MATTLKRKQGRPAGHLRDGIRPAPTLLSAGSDPGRSKRMQFSKPRRLNWSLVIGAANGERDYCKADPYNERTTAGSNQFALSYTSESVIDTRTELASWADARHALGTGSFLILRGPRLGARLQSRQPHSGRVPDAARHEVRRRRRRRATRRLLVRPQLRPGSRTAPFAICHYVSNWMVITRGGSAAETEYVWIEQPASG
jgi:hypothetical protein